MTNEAMALAIALPLLGGLAAAAWPTRSRGIGILTVLLSGASVIWLFLLVMSHGEAYQLLGGWQPGLAIALHADALSTLMLLLTALVTLAVSVYATRYFRSSREAAGFWPLWLLLLAALNGLFLSADLFNLYVTLELLGLSAVSYTHLRAHET